MAARCRFQTFCNQEWICDDLGTRALTKSVPGPLHKIDEPRILHISSHQKEATTDGDEHSRRIGTTPNVMRSQGTRRSRLGGDSSAGGLAWSPLAGRRDCLQVQGGRDWLQTPKGHWLLHGGRHRLQSQDGEGWLQTPGGEDWLQTPGAQNWLQTQGGRDWLQTPDGRDWLQTAHGQTWRLTTVWVTMKEFSNSLEAITVHNCLFSQVIQQLKNLPDFLVFLALRRQDHPTSALPRGCFPPNIEIIHPMQAFVQLRKRNSRTNSISFRRSQLRMSKLGHPSIASSESMG